MLTNKNAIQILGNGLQNQIDIALKEVSYHAYQELKERMVSMFSNLGLDYSVRFEPSKQEFKCTVEMSIPRFKLLK